MLSKHMLRSSQRLLHISLNSRSSDEILISSNSLTLISLAAAVHSTELFFPTTKMGVKVNAEVCCNSEGRSKREYLNNMVSYVQEQITIYFAKRTIDECSKNAQKLMNEEVS
mmetsp:Transcript_42469/g.48254  ORF Transcript_42469/g.48254 Transcript_42469/m.48254 type:complete len:112 (-) Transcript_42469:26-361(-)